MQNIRFIINPKSGIGNKNLLSGLINKFMDSSKFNSEVCLTKEPGHATELAKYAVENNYDVVVAVGGDGSVNETAKALINSRTGLGIIPTGSGNGMARHLGIPVDVIKAIKVFNEGEFEKIDTLTVNELFCVGTIGIGFDAHIAHLFAKSEKRGYSTYVKLVLKEFSSYKEKRFSILVDGVESERNCFLLTFANSSQFGNNAVIAPFADVKDGIIDVSMMSRFPAIIAPVLIWRLMNNNIHNSKYYNSLRGKNIVVKNQSTIQGHIDGEPVLFHSDLVITINPLSLQVVIPRRK